MKFDAEPSLVFFNNMHGFIDDTAGDMVGENSRAFVLKFNWEKSVLYIFTLVNTSVIKHVLNLNLDF